MRLYPYEKQEDIKEIHDLINFSETCELLTLNEDLEIEVGIFNPILIDEKIYLHLQIKDEQIKSLEKNQKATLIFKDILGMFPSYWGGTEYAGAATTYYRYLRANCHIKMIYGLEDQIPFLAKMMKHFQNEGGYLPMTTKDKTYEGLLKRICIVEMTPFEYIGKWKLGQNRDEKQRLEIAQHFRNRNLANDHRCAFEIEKDIKKRA